MLTTVEEAKRHNEISKSIATIALEVAALGREIEIYSIGYSKQTGLSIGISPDSLVKLPGEIHIRPSTSFDSSSIFFKIVGNIEFYSTRIPSGVKFKLVQLETEPSEAAA